MTEALRPCPFCGGDAEVFSCENDDLGNEVGVRCKTDCGGGFNTVVSRWTRLAKPLDVGPAIDAWNRRAALAEHDAAIRDDKARGE